MKLTPLIFALLLGLFACNNEKNNEQIKEEINSKKQQLISLQNEISKLEEELLDDSTKSDVDSRILVEIKQIKKEQFEHTFKVNGTIEAIKVANLSPEAGGKINTILVKEGDAVQKGQYLVKLSTTVIEKTLEELESGLGLARTIFDRQDRLWNKKIGSEIEYLQAKNNLENLEKKREGLKAQMEMASIKAPFSGIIDKIMQKEGELASPGIPILTLVNLNKMKIVADVSEKYALAIKPNTEIKLDFPAFGYSTSSKIRNVGNIINPLNRTFTLETVVNNTKKLLKPNGSAILTITDFQDLESLIVPSICIEKDTKGDFIFVVKKQNAKYLAKKTYIQTGQSSNGQTRILEGLKTGDQVITKGYNEVTTGDEVLIQN